MIVGHALTARHDPSFFSLQFLRVMAASLAMKPILLPAAILLLAVAVARPDQDLPERDCGVPPPKPAQHRAGGEGVPPLPLPAVPMRRTEKKEPPAPPTLLAHLQLGPYESWNADPGALDRKSTRLNSS